MATTLAIELTKAGFTVGGSGTTILVQDYADPSVVNAHAQITGSHTITATDPILNTRFINGYEWNGARRIVAYDANNIYILVNLGYPGAGFKAFPLNPSAITGVTPLPGVSERATRTRRPSQGGIGTPAGDG